VLDELDVLELVDEEVGELEVLELVDEEVGELDVLEELEELELVELELDVVDVLELVDEEVGELDVLLELEVVLDEDVDEVVVVVVLPTIRKCPLPWNVKVAGQMPSTGAPIEMFVMMMLPT